MIWLTSLAFIFEIVLLGGKKTRLLSAVGLGRILEDPELSPV